jgi:hypothetical protein
MTQPDQPLIIITGADGLGSMAQEDIEAMAAEVKLIMAESFPERDVFVWGEPGVSQSFAGPGNPLEPLEHQMVIQFSDDIKIKLDPLTEDDLARAGKEPLKFRRQKDWEVSRGGKGKKARRR